MPWWPAEPSSVASSDLQHQLRSTGPLAVAEAEQRPRRSAEVVLQDHQRGDPDAAADQQHPPARLRRGEAPPERPHGEHPLTRLQLAQPARAGTHVLEQEVGLLAGVAGDRQGAGQERALVLASAPAVLRSQHRELPGSAVAARVEHPQQAVGAELLVGGDLEQAASPVERSRGPSSRHAGPAREGRRWTGARRARAARGEAPAGTAPPARRRGRRGRSRGPPRRRPRASSGRGCRGTRRRGGSHSRRCGPDAGGGVDDQVHLAPLDPVEHVR